MTRLILRDTSEAQVFDLEIFVHAILGAFAPEARLFDAAERRNLGRNDAGVDADDAVFERLRNPPDAHDVLAIKIAGQAKFSVVRERDGFGFCLEAE